MKRMYFWGLITGFGLGCLYFLSSTLLQSPQEGVSPPRFGVVDTYEGCDVVKWNGNNEYDYQFFLDCRKDR